MNNPNDFNFIANQEQPFSMEQFSINDNEAVLILTSPRRMQNLCVRPLTYNFNNSVIDELAERVDMKLAGQKDMTNVHSPNLMNAVLPAGNGIPVSGASILSDSWTFVLIVNIIPSRARYGLQGPTKRFIATGFCIDEPVNPMTMNMYQPTVNPGALLQITHSTSVLISDSIRQQTGFNISRKTELDNDNILQQTSQFYDEDIYVINSKKIRESGTLDPNGGIACTTGHANVNANNEATVVPSYENSPKHHLNNICNAIESAVNTHKSSQIVDNLVLGQNPVASPYNNFMSTFDADIINSNTLNNIKLGFNTNVPLSMNDVIREFPDINIIPIAINGNGSLLDERPQTLIAQQNIMSSLVVDCLTTIVSNCGLSEIMFRFNSYFGDNLNNNKGYWEVMHACELVPGTEQTLRASLSQFKTLMERDVFPIMINYGGDFDLTCKFDITGESIIDFQFMDQPALDGYYVHHNKLGGVTSPLIGTIDNLNCNASQLQGLLNGMSIKTLAILPGDDVGYAEDEYDNGTYGQYGSREHADIFNTRSNNLYL